MSLEDYFFLIAQIIVVFFNITTKWTCYGLRLAEEKINETIPKELPKMSKKIVKKMNTLKEYCLMPTSGKKWTGHLKLTPPKGPPPRGTRVSLCPAYWALQWDDMGICRTSVTSTLQVKAGILHCMLRLGLFLIPQHSSTHWPLGDFIVP